MHHRGRLSATPDDLGTYAGHSRAHTRRELIGRSCGSAHQEVVVADLDPGGAVDRHLHAFEEVIYVLEGELVLDIAGELEHLASDDYVFVDRGVAHELRNESTVAARWFEVSAPQPGGDLKDTVFVAGAEPDPNLEIPYWRAHFDADELPAPTATIGLAGFGGGNVGGAVAKIIVGPDTGASQLNLMIVQYAPGGFIKRHDHAFEEGFFFLTGEIEAELDGETHTLQPGDYCWSSVGSMHALANTTDTPVRWLETQAPQPPSRYQARFVGDWEAFVS